MVLHGLLVDGLMRVHLCGPACEFRARIAAGVIPSVDGAGDSVERGEEVVSVLVPETLSRCCCERW